MKYLCLGFSNKLTKLIASYVSSHTTKPSQDFIMQRQDTQAMKKTFDYNPFP